MKLTYQNAPFLGETKSKSVFDGVEKEKVALSFGPLQTKKGFVVVNIKRGETDKTQYEVGNYYDVEVSASCFKDTIYWTSLTASPAKVDKAK